MYLWANLIFSNLSNSLTATGLINEWVSEIKSRKLNRKLDLDCSTFDSLVMEAPILFDSQPLNGLRGLVAIHILVFHSLLKSSWGFSIYAQVSTVQYLFSGIKFSDKIRFISN